MLASGFPLTQGATQEIIIVDSWPFSNILLENGVSGRLLTDNHPSDSGTSSLGQTFRPSQDISAITKASFSISRGGVGGNPTVTMVAVISSSDGAVPTTELFRSTTIISSSNLNPSGVAVNIVSFTFGSGQSRLTKNAWYSLEVQTSATGTIDIGNNVRVDNPDSTLMNHQGSNFFYGSSGYVSVGGGTEDFVFEVQGSTGGFLGGGGIIQDPSTDQPSPLPVLGGSTAILVIAGIGAVYFLGLRGKRGRIG
jgi:hypothetical protein